MNKIKSLNVTLGDRRVGTLAVATNHLIAFEYEEEWIRNGFSISPFSLPLQKGVFIPKRYDPFEGLFGVFSDSLPDGWGRLLVGRLLLREKISPSEVGAINRLAIAYEGFFATKRFDRDGDKRIHMLSASALLETSHRLPNLDYNILMQLTLRLTNDYRQVWQMFRLMCFNVFSHNRDDHSKNFSYIYNEDESRWILSPAYDLTFSNSIGGEHATTVDGNGKNPGMKELLAVAKNVKLDQNKARNIAKEIHDIVLECLKL